jgi:hypothetical protein
LFDPAHSTNHARRHISLESHDRPQRPNCQGPALYCAEQLGISIGGLIGSIIAATVGAVILLALLQLINGRSDERR